MPEPETAYTLRLEVYIEPEPYQGERLSIRESVTLNVSSFLEMAKVLSQFHDLAESLKGT